MTSKQSDKLQPTKRKFKETIKPVNRKRARPVIELDEENEDSDKEDKCAQCSSGDYLVNCDSCFQWYCLNCIGLHSFPKTKKWYCAFCEDDFEVCFVSFVEIDFIFKSSNLSFHFLFVLLSSLDITIFSTTYR